MSSCVFMVGRRKNVIYNVHCQIQSRQLKIVHAVPYLSDAESCESVWANLAFDKYAARNGVADDTFEIIPGAARKTIQLRGEIQSSD
jgi:hypothetical protein